MESTRSKQLNFIASGEQRYREWATNLLFTLEARARYEEIAADFDLRLRLTEARLDAGLTRRQLAVRLGVTKKQVKRIETCDCGRHYTVALLKAYAKEVGLALCITVA